MANRFQTVDATLRAELAKPYVEGESDCFFLGCRMADALDPALGLVKKYWRAYTTILGAQKALRKRGHKTLADLFSTHLTACAPAEAQLGDIVILQLVDGQHVGICLGIRFVTKTSAGRSYHFVADCVAAFRTGDAA
ncbi:DUF6950 family protein [Mesorhizobium qingshengii]|uniref:DUF6950 domain-containing protein n=1 Tax=Mesorhizobium qingshengii TaxID=1165689 RepID=A0A1G5V131_9HYPH|nr:hypothetical protein [Mesorhizobium qingshengii]SDA39086.1 hypothetical protein SAMN02927914_00108 [Mesorhizobium qingshengii]